jgi:hypothetical protein
MILNSQLELERELRKSQEISPQATVCGVRLGALFVPSPASALVQEQHGFL